MSVRTPYGEQNTMNKEPEILCVHLWLIFQSNTHIAHQKNPKIAKFFSTPLTLYPIISYLFFACPS